MEAVETLRLVLEHELRLSLDYHVELIVHPVGVNWRERHRTPRSQALAVHESLMQPGPFEGRLIQVADLAVTLPGLLGPVPAGRAVSVTSRIYDDERTFVGHLAIMNLHPVGFRSTDELCQALQTVCGEFQGLLLASGRFHHYYGFRLLDSSSWLRFLAQFLMPCTLVSPRYVGHSLYRGFCALRLNKAGPYKAVVPHVVRRVWT